MTGLKFAIVGAALFMAGPAPSAEVTAETLKIYAGLAKLEANVVETAGAVALASLMAGNVDAYDESAEEAEEDIEAIADYLTELRALGLTDAQRAALDEFEAAWAPLAAEAKALLSAAASGAVDRDAVYAWWERVERKDQIVDDALDATLETHGVSFDD
jgi:hypothetical protein